MVRIASTASDFNPCHASAPALVETIRRGGTRASGLPFTFPTISLHESFAHPSSLFLRRRRLGACTDCRRLWTAWRAGEADEQELREADSRTLEDVVAGWSGWAGPAVIRRTRSALRSHERRP